MATQPNTSANRTVSTAAGILTESANQSTNASPQHSLADMAGAGTKKASSKEAALKANEWEMVLTADMKAVASDWIAATVVLDPISKREKNLKTEVTRYGIQKVAEQIFRTKSKVSNPRVFISNDRGQQDHNFIFMFQNKFRLELPPVPEGANQRAVYIKAFVDAGLHPTSAANLVDTELDFSVQIELRSPKELTEGHYGQGREFIPATDAEKSVGQKLINLVMWNGTGTPPAALSEEVTFLCGRESLFPPAFFLVPYETYHSYFEKRCDTNSFVAPPIPI